MMVSANCWLAAVDVLVFDFHCGWLLGIIQFLKRAVIEEGEYLLNGCILYSGSLPALNIWEKDLCCNAVGMRSAE